jgi:hypothetical protein
MGAVVITSESFIVDHVAGVGKYVRPPMLSLVLPSEAGSWQVAPAVIEMLRKSHYVIMQECSRLVRCNMFEALQSSSKDLEQLVVFACMFLDTTTGFRIGQIFFDGTAAI